MLPSPDECTFHRQTVVSTRSQFIAPPVLAKWLQIAALLFFMCRRVLPHARTTVEMRNSRARNATSPAISSPNLASLNRLKELEKCEQLPRSATNVVNWNSATFASCAKNKEKKKLSLFGGGFTQKSRAHGNGGNKKLFLVRCELVVQFGFFFVLGKICSLFFLCHSWCLKIVSAAIRTRKKTVVQKKKSAIRLCLYTQIRISVADGCFVFWGQQSRELNASTLRDGSAFFPRWTLELFSLISLCSFRFGLLRSSACSRCRGGDVSLRVCFVPSADGESSMINARTERWPIDTAMFVRLTSFVRIRKTFHRLHVSRCYLFYLQKTFLHACKLRSARKK